MESNGKSVNRFGEPVDYVTGPVSYTHLDVYKRQNMSCRHICGTKLFGFYGIFNGVDRGSDNLEELLIIVSAF